MPDWLIDIAGPEYAKGVLWTFAALVLLVLFLLIVKLIRSMTFGTFVAGGRNRKTRLAVMDATAVDSHRRLVLVRRDDVEHLILIGGPTDVVVEQGIHLGQVRRPAPAGTAPREQAPQPQQPLPRPTPPRAPQPVPRPQVAPRPQAAPAPAARTAPPATTPPAPAGPMPAPAARVAPPVQPTTRNSYLPRDLQGPTTAAPTTDDLDRALVSELTLSLDEPAPKTAHTSIEDEMNKLLGELSSPKR
ncbi:MAG TPA: hypothetical protein GX405_10445 [Rhizobiales bacterium]|nr:hypothetical protein [Hyphomicrobiales bacterium]